jgi:hypothetical protein
LEEVKALLSFLRMLKDDDFLAVIRI